MTMLNKVVILILTIVFGALAGGCNSNKQRIYATDPQSVVIYADLEINSGAPRPGVTCRFPSVPVLRIWGDGLAYVRIPGRSGNTSDKLYKGNLASQQVSSLLDDLAKQGFLGDWTPEMPSPAANYLHVGVNLADHSKEHSFSSLEPAFYNELLSKLTSSLAQVTPADIVESRIHELNTSRECTTPTPPS